MVGMANRKQEDLDIMALWTELKERVRQNYPIDVAIEDVTGGAGSIRWQNNGRTRKACCPFHMEKTPSFEADTGRGLYRCWGAGCNAHGDIFKLFQDVRGLTFKEAVIEAADRAGVEVHDVIRKSAGNPVHKPGMKRASRPTQGYAPGQVRQVPDNLPDADLIPVPEGSSVPVVGKFFRVWQDGGRWKDKEFRSKNYKPEMVHKYRGTNGDLLMVVLRCLKADGGKYFIPARLIVPQGDCPSFLLEKATDTAGKRLAWVNEGPKAGVRRPVYGMEDVAEWHRKRGTKLLIVEGEKCRDTARRILKSADPYGNWLVLSPMGGAGSSVYADWAPMLKDLDRKIEVHIWQDADKPLKRPDGKSENRQQLYAGQIATSLLQAAVDNGVDRKSLKMIWMGEIKGKESGWDISDAEGEDWTPDEIMKFITDRATDVSEKMINLREPPRKRADASSPDPEVHEAGGPFESDFSSEEFDIYWFDQENNEDQAVTVHTQTTDDIPVPLPDEIEPEIVAVENVAVDLSGVEDVTPLIEDDEVSNFRALGFLDGNSYFLSLDSNQIFVIPPRGYTMQYLLHLAPLDHWSDNFEKPGGRGNEPSIDWPKAFDTMIQACYNAGPWDPRREVKQGARIDGRTVVFHTGQKLYIHGQGTQDLHSFHGRNCYTMGPPARTPDFENPFPENSDEIRQYLDIISSLNWRDETRELSIMAVFGWVMISPICGVLKWRSHLWIDGQRASGKTWIVENLIAPALGDYAERVVSNSSESGIRNLLNRRAMPIIFDEAEGEDKEDRSRMDAILRLARHSASESSSVVAHGVSGGGGHKDYSIASTFLMTSIMPQLEAAADKTRFGRARLAPGRNYDEFVKNIEEPAAELLTESFSDRLVARMVMRATDYPVVYQSMVKAMTALGLERRLSDVYGTFAAGAWLALRDDVPEDHTEAVNFFAETFNIVQQIQDYGKEMNDDRDHVRIFREIISIDFRTETRNAGLQTFQIGDLIERACGVEKRENGENVDYDTLSREEAVAKLSALGMRPAIAMKKPDGTDGYGPCPIDQRPEFMFIHKNSTRIRDLLEKTPYARSYVDVIHQADGVTMGEPIRFGAGLGVSRTLIVPLKHFYVEGYA